MKGDVMRVPIENVAKVFRAGFDTARDSSEQLRVGVYVDASATPFLIQTIRDAFVPQLTSALVRVARVASPLAEVKTDTDVAIVITCGSAELEACVNQLVVAGIPTVCVAESSVEVPFIVADTAMRGLIASTNKTFLLESLARWILDRTEKDMAFAANFPFMRIAAAHRIVGQASIGNALTGALFFVPGSNYPVMAMQQLGMMFALAETYGRGLKVERAYEAAGMLACGLVFRTVSRAICKHTPHVGFLIQGLIGGAGTYVMGRALMELYERNVSYAALNDLVGKTVRTARRVVSPAAEA